MGLGVFQVGYLLPTREAERTTVLGLWLRLGLGLCIAATVDGPGNVPNNGVTSQTTAAAALAYVF